jgi:hypothetical protein
MGKVYRRVESGSGQADPLTVTVHCPESVDLRVLNLAPLPFCYEVTARGQRLWAADVGKVRLTQKLSSATVVPTGAR